MTEAGKEKPHLLLRRLRLHGTTLNEKMYRLTAAEAVRVCQVNEPHMGLADLAATLPVVPQTAVRREMYGRPLEPDDMLHIEVDGCQAQLAEWRRDMRAAQRHQAGLLLAGVGLAFAAIGWLPVRGKLAGVVVVVGVVLCLALRDQLTWLYAKIRDVIRSADAA